MRNVPQAALDLIPQTKQVGVRATFRKTLPSFAHYSLTEGISLAGTSWVDVCTYDTGILRVTSVGNVLYTQYVSNIHGAWPAWTNTGISLYAGSVPAVDGGYVWYQKADGNICYRDYASWDSEVVVKNVAGAVAIAPIATRAWYLKSLDTKVYELISANGGQSRRYVLYDLSSMPRIDAVSFGGKEYFYTVDRDAGRIIEIKHTGNSLAGQDNYGVGKAIVPIDAIDDVYGLMMGYAGVVDNKVVVTGRLTRTSDDTAVSMEIYAAGPEYFSLGKEMYIQSDYDARGKLLRVGDYFIVSAPGNYWLAKATTVFGGTSHADLEITTSDLASFTLTEAEGRSTSLNIDLSTDLDHPALAVGSELVLEMAYNNNWTVLTTCNLDADQVSRTSDGTSRIVSGIGKSAKRLTQWSPDQGVYIPSQARIYDNAGNMTKVVRASGQWERVSENGPLILKDLNKLCYLYSAARSSRGGSMRARFWRPNDAYVRPYYGLAINFYRDTALEAAAAAGVDPEDLTDDDYLLNGIVAAYSSTNGGNGLPGVAVYLYRDGSGYVIGRNTLDVAPETWHWLEVSFVEGQVIVRYKIDNGLTSEWNDLVTADLPRSGPWKKDNLGRGAIFVKNWVPEVKCFPLSSTDTTLGVDNHVQFPSTGTLLVDGEEMTYSSKSAVEPPPPWQGGTPPPEHDSNPYIFWLNNHAICWEPAPGFTGTRVHLANEAYSYSDDRGPTAGVLPEYDNAYEGLALVLMSSWDSSTGYKIFPTGGRTCRITGYDAGGPRWWATNTATYPSGWKNFMGNLSYGTWIAGAGAGLFTDVDINNWLGFGDSPREGIDDGVKAMACIKWAFHISARGANGTTATSHSVSIAQYKPANPIRVDLVASFTQEEDQSIEEALKTIATLAGGKATCRSEVDETRAFTANSVLNVSGDHKDFIATMELPSSITVGKSIGFAFRGTTPFSMVGVYPTNTSKDGYWLCVTCRQAGVYYLEFGKVVTNGVTPLDSIRLSSHWVSPGSTNIPVGTMKVSVQGSFFSVWLDGRFIFGFHDETYASGTQMAFASGFATSAKIYLSELDDLLADIVVGTRGNGMSVLSELLADRHILWRNEPDGSLYFYRARTWVGDMPDIVANVASVKTDSVVSRMRAEGLNISEILDAELIRDHGNVFETVNARHANTVDEARREAQLLIEENWRNSRPKRYSIVPHPGLQPGDAAGFMDAPNTTTDVIVHGLTMTVGFTGNNFAADMQCDVVPYQRS